MSERRRAGRPSRFNVRTAARVLNELMQGTSLAVLCRRPDMPPQRTVYRWLVKHPEFRHDYVIARAIQAECLADEILEIADAVGEETRNEPDAIERARLRIQARRWYLGRLRPHTHGAAAVIAPAIAAPASHLPSLSATERVQRLLALVKGARNVTPTIDKATSGEATNEEKDGAAE